MDWSDVYRTWKSEIESFNIDFVDFFQEILIEIPTGNDRKPELTWLERGTTERHKENLVAHLKEYPNTIGPIHSLELNKGELNTIMSMWEVRDNPEKLAALLICASLFCRTKSSRGNYPIENWPLHSEVKEVYEVAEDIWKRMTNSYNWHHSCYDVIPVQSDDYDFKIESISALISYLAIEHCKLASKYQPVRIVFKKK